MKIWRSRLLVIGSSIALLANFSLAGENSTKRAKRAQTPIKITAVPWGPTQADVDAAKARIEKSMVLRNALKGAKYRLMSFDYIENGNGEKSQPSKPPTRFRAVFYDYTNDRTFVAESNFAATETIAVRQENFKPGVSSEELNAAFEIIKADEKLGLLYKQNKLKIFEAMPPVTDLNGERLVNVGVTFLSEGENQIVGVSFKNEKVVRYKDNAPPTSQAQPETCGIANAQQSTTPNGTPGQLQLTVSQNNATLWEMLVIRPSASSGNSSERSGIEIRDVKYKGKSVLKRGHVPILDVKYAGDVCGPFRDWQYSEGFFDAPESGAQDPTPGFRILAPGQIAQTALDSGNDLGNFQGVAIYTQDVGFGLETILVTEMNAGWYRYIMEWRFAPDGTIRPRYGFGSVTNSCVCSVHSHHVYWRFDFDIVSPTNKIFQVERGRKFMQPVTNEVARLRNYQTNRSFLIQNATSDEAYMIVPNISDGVTDTFGGGDFWFLRYKGTADAPDELDDPNTDQAANLTPWLNNESLVNQDVVVWYAAHFIHNDGGELLNPNRSGDVLTNSHVVGPNLVPVRW